MEYQRKIQSISGAFLLGIATIAVFDQWTSGLPILLGLCWLGWVGFPRWRQAPGAVLLIAAGGALALRDLFQPLPGYVLPLTLIGIALLVLVLFDVSSTAD
ncbi:MAG: hypothetical protein AAF125_10720 [Chloroflexota bacterium]